MLFFNKAFQLEQDFFSYREIRFEIVQIRISSGLNHYSNQTNMRGLTLQFFDRQKKKSQFTEKNISCECHKLLLSTNQTCLSTAHTAFSIGTVLLRGLLSSRQTHRVSKRSTPFGKTVCAHWGES